MKKTFFGSILFFAATLTGHGQGPTVPGQVNATRIPLPAVPFLTISPDARSGALGDAGAALNPTDANSTYWNVGKLPFSPKKSGVSLSYTPWLRNYIGDMWISYLSGYTKIGKNQAIGLSLNYFNLGEIQFTNNQGVSQGEFASKEFAATVSYGLKLSDNLGLGINLRYINSNLVGNQVINSTALKAGQTVAGDIGLYRQGNNPDRRWTANYGVVLQNIGGRINYGGTGTPYPIPTNLKIGTALVGRLGEANTLNITLDANKLMVPTPPVYDANGQVVQGKDPARLSTLGGMFGSFTDAPGGFSEELQEITLSAGAEYWWRNIVAVRGGYFYENPNKGNRSFITTGFGVHYNQYGLDFSYLFQGNTEQNPLNNTLRLTLTIKLDGKNSISAVDESNN